LTLPRIYLQKLSEGRITARTLPLFLHKQKTTSNARSLQTVWKMSNTMTKKQQHLPRCRVATQVDAIRLESFYALATNFYLGKLILNFDNGQSHLVRQRISNQRLFMAREIKKPLSDLTPELSGLKGFRKLVKAFTRLSHSASQFALQN